MEEPRPDLIISIDFGMTCTGIAYCNISTGSDAVRHIQRWPGRMQANENKVPTLLVYPEGSQSPSSWGFLAETAQEQSGDGYESREWFKILLDEDLLERMRKNSGNPAKIPSIEEVQKWYTDYFTALYSCIETRLKGELASRWEDARVEFIFSVPTTWRPNPTVQRFERIIRRAGFGKHAAHTAVIGLTEAEAAAVHTARNTPAIFSENDILFVCDIGGGTTDLSAFRVKNTSPHLGGLTLEQIDVVFGATIGAAQLDSLFEDSVLQRLIAANEELPMGLEDLHQAAWEMRVSKEYQNAKCDFGSEESYLDTETFSVRIPKLDRSYMNNTYEIGGGEMVFRRDNLKTFFDAQIDKLYETIDRQLARLQEKLPNQQVAHMVISGGLGNSTYVQNCLRDRYSYGNSAHVNAGNLQIRVAPDPQLVVCKGNVADRVQKIKAGQSVLGWRCSRTSYGVLCRIVYEPNNPAHYGVHTHRDPLDGLTYVVNAIDWFIKQGEPVSSSHPIVRQFKRKCAPSTSKNPYPSRVFPTEVVSSDIDKSMLPVTMNSSCQSICKVESDFSTLPLTMFKLKNRHWWQTAAKYHRINFCVKVNIEPAAVGFELWHEGVKLNKDTTIKIEWHPSPPPTVNDGEKIDIPFSSLILADRPAVRERNWSGNSQSFSGKHVGLVTASELDLGRNRTYST